MNPRPIVCLACCHKDIEQTVLWLRWVAFLNRSATPSSKSEQMVVMATRRVYRSGSLEVINQVIRIQQETWWRADVVECPDENEIGYPASASHLFLRALQYCEREYPGRAVLWVEPDCLPLHRRWFQVLADEYEQCGHAFMGEKIAHPGRKSCHMSGNGIYPHDWRQRAPKILTAADAPDHPMFGVGKGYPWDVWACEETTRDLHETRLVQQIFNARPFSDATMSQLRPGAAIFHRCKNGTLITELARRDHPEFLAQLPEPTETFQMIGHPSRLRTLGFPDMPWRSIRRGGGWFSTCRPTDRAHAAVLRCLAGSKGISVAEAEEPAIPAHR